MSIINVNNQSIFIGIGSDVWCKSEHNDSFDKLNLSPNLKSGFIIKDIVSSNCGTYLAILTSNKYISIHKTPDYNVHSCLELPRAGSKITFTKDSRFILAADKTGDVFIFDIDKGPSHKGDKLLGHLSLLTSIVMTPNNKFIITSDRDEKIRISNYPDSYNIQSFCLGHKEFVTSIHLLPHNDKYLVSTSGDGTVKIWDYLRGIEVFSINVNSYADESVYRNFQKAMKEDDIKVASLPINFSSCCKISESSTLIAVSLYTYNTVLVFKVSSIEDKFSSELVHEISLNGCVIGILLTPESLWICSTSDFVKLEKWNLTEKGYSLGNTHSFDIKELSVQEDITFLYKRKFDNLKEYQKKKKQRLGVD